jgi:hypothetical protein
MPSPTTPSARTLANRANRVVMHHDSLDLLQMGIADGFAELGPVIVADYAAHAPRDPEIAAERGVPMMADAGSWQVWALGKRAAGDWQAKPRGVGSAKGEVVLIVQVNSPIAHFAELGTVNEAARPSLLPAFIRHIPDAGRFVVPAMGKRMRLGKLGSIIATNMGYRVGQQGGVQGMVRKR